MSVAIATMGYFAPPPGDSGGDTAPYAYGGGSYPGALPLKERRLKVDVAYLQVNISEQEKPKLKISPIKVDL